MPNLIPGTGNLNYLILKDIFPIQEKQPYFNLLIYYSGEVLAWLKNNQPIKRLLR